MFGSRPGIRGRQSTGYSLAATWMDAVPARGPESGPRVGVRSCLEPCRKFMANFSRSLLPVKAPLSRVWNRLRLEPGLQPVQYHAGRRQRRMATEVNLRNGA
jgi:hypothetical protein